MLSRVYPDVVEGLPAKGAHAGEQKLIQFAEDSHEHILRAQCRVVALGWGRLLHAGRGEANPGCFVYLQTLLNHRSPALSAAKT